MSIKIATIITFLFTIISVCKADSNEDTLNVRNLTINQFKTKIVNDSSISMEEVEKYATEMDDKLENIFNRDVISYFELDEFYDSPLKRKMFIETDDYKNKYRLLDSLRSGFFFQKNSPEKLKDYWGDINWNYDIDKKGFNIKFNENSTSGRPSKCIEVKVEYENGSRDYWIRLNKLPLSRIKSTVWRNVNMWEEFLFIPTSESIGLEVENSKDDIELLFIVKLGNREKISYQWVNTGVLPFRDVLTQEYITNADFLRLMLLNKQTGKIYFDKTYK